MNKEYIQSEFPSIKMEYTAPYSPKQNGLLERAITFIMDRTRSMINSSGFDGKLCEHLWKKAEQHSVILDNLHVRTKGKSSFKLFLNKKYDLIYNLKVFGRIAVVVDENRTRNLENKGKLVIFIGIPSNHSARTYLFYDTKKNQSL